MLSNLLLVGVSYLLKFVGGVIFTFLICLGLTSARFAASEGSNILSNCKLYVGKVKHSRLKGGAQHFFEYPIFFAYIDLQQIQNVGNLLWPIFVSNDGRMKTAFSFCSLDSSEHLKKFSQSIPDARIPLYDMTLKFLKSSGLQYPDSNSIRLLTHLTYFGYCFNPVSFFYVFDDSGEIHSIITEVSNTPWIEQHPYILHESTENVRVKRSSYGDDNYSFSAVWKKDFHVSPFMEMDYNYDFSFIHPGRKLKVIGKLLKEKTNELWFSAKFDVDAIAFSPINLCYVLIWYPLHTRVIQVLIHWEAMKLFYKGVSIYPHPNGTDVDFGFGVTGDFLQASFATIAYPFLAAYKYFTTTHPRK
jgi:DUF1365 family protein